MPPVGDNFEGKVAIVTGWGSQFFGGNYELRDTIDLQSLFYLSDE